MSAWDYIGFGLLIVPAIAVAPRTVLVVLLALFVRSILA